LLRLARRTVITSRKVATFTGTNSWRSACCPWRAPTIAAVRPIFHQHQDRIEAHIFVAFLACTSPSDGVCTRWRPVLPRSVLEKFAAIQMIDVHIPTSDGGELMLTRYTEPQAELKLLLEKLRLELPAQPPPKITAL
jgi:hypothetical protein